MKRVFIISLCVFSLCLGWLASEQNAHVPETPTHPSTATPPSPLPGPARAKAAAKRVKPGLTRDLAALGLHFGDPVFLRAFKEERQLEAWVRRREDGKYQLFRTWEVAAQSGTPGPKRAEGDGQVPEGFYFVPRSGMKPDSTFHLAFNIGYPNAYDRHHGRTGSFIMIHGNQVSIGCLAMTDAKIEEIYTLCDAALTGGQGFFRVHFFPFRMTGERMERAKDDDHKWFAFWSELREGHDFFEKHRVPPEVTVVGGKYHFRLPR
jgi:murein L,D-transpeptidase YafK